MFLSADHLSIKYGIHDSIAKFFVDREPPANNLYWKDKLLYLRHDPGYIFIPVIVDTLFRLGISKETLLSEAYVGLLEKIGHIAALEETKQINQQQAVQMCIELTEAQAINKNFYSALNNYMKGDGESFINYYMLPFKALHRGDIFLYTVTILPIDDALAKKIVQHWFVIIGSFIMLDDAHDIEQDKKTGEENAFLESGLDKEGINKITEMLATNLRFIKNFNKSLARTIDDSFVKMAELPNIKPLLNQ